MCANVIEEEAPRILSWRDSYLSNSYCHDFQISMFEIGSGIRIKSKSLKSGVDRDFKSIKYPKKLSLATMADLRNMRLQLKRVFSLNYV